MPESWGLGVHLTLDLEGRARFGPDVEWIDKVEYKTSPEICDKFYPVIRQYWPGLPDGRLRPSYSGIRPKVKCIVAHPVTSHKSQGMRAGQHPLHPCGPFLVLPDLMHF